MTGEDDRLDEDDEEGCGVLRLTVSRLGCGSSLTSGFASTFGGLELEATGDEVTRCRASSRAV